MNYTVIACDTDLTATDLCNEIAAMKAQGVPFATAIVEIDGKAERAQVLFIPSAGRGGIAWGGDADWTDAGSISEVMDRFCNDEMVH